MTIREFTNSIEKEEIDKHLVRLYCPVNTKLVIAENIAKQMYTATDDGGRTVRNSVARHLLERVNFVLMYTDFERSDNLADEYDAVAEYGLVEQLIDFVGEEEWKEFDRLIDITCADQEYNTTEPHNYVREQVERFGTLIGASLGPVLEGIDWEKVVGGLTPPNSEGGTTEL